MIKTANVLRQSCFSLSELSRNKERSKASKVSVDLKRLEIQRFPKVAYT